jgi:hypothetical protein
VRPEMVAGARYALFLAFPEAPSEVASKRRPRLVSAAPSAYLQQRSYAPCVALNRNSSGFSYARSAARSNSVRR